jgi:two-component system, LytTR family, response regulator
MTLRTAIADDEPLARKRVRSLLAAEPDIEVVAECHDGRETIAAIARHRPDLLFLDVEMPEVDGFGVLEQVGPENMPLVIFVTAYDHYAVKAFEANALDYLLKPFDEERFSKALARARIELQHARNGRTRQLSNLLTDVGKNKERSKGFDRLVIRSSGRIIFLNTQEVDWIEAAANYVRIHTGSESYLFRETMASLEARLDPRRFMRIHRSTIVNVEKIRELHPCNNGEYIVVLRSGKELSLSRSFRHRLQQFLRSMTAKDAGPGAATYDRGSRV